MQTDDVTDQVVEQEDLSVLAEVGQVGADAEDRVFVGGSRVDVLVGPDVGNVRVAALDGVERFLGSGAKTAAARTASIGAARTALRARQPPTVSTPRERVSHTQNFHIRGFRSKRT